MREQKKCKKTNENAITLIALIVSIIIMLILAGVSINAIVGDNGIITQAINAKTLTELASEKEEISYIVIDGYSGDISIGTPLYDKTLANGNIWNIVVINDTQEIYGTGWYYIEEGTDIGDYGETKYGWLVNYETGEIVQLEEDNYTQLDYLSSLAVTDGLVFNLDSSVLEDATEENIEELLGDGVELHNFNWDEDSGLSATSLKFDGVDDYITFEITDDLDFEDGITFEFYGIIYGDTVYDSSYNSTGTNNWGVFFSFTSSANEFTSKAAAARMIIRNSQSFVSFSGVGISEDFGGLDGGLGWNVPMWTSLFSYGDVVYLTCVVDIDSEMIFGYFNGELVYEHEYLQDWWQIFLDADKNYINFAGCYYSNWLSICKQEVYTTRVYNRGLTEEEVLESYNTSVAFHTLLEN